MIIAVLSKKGGVGKTTSTVSIAGALARRGRKILLVDLDPQASASLWLGVARAELAPSIADVLLGQTRIDNAIRHTRLENLDLITSSTDLTAAEHELSRLGQGERAIARHLNALRDDYQYVLLDCPPGLGFLPSSALLAADAFLVPTPPQFLALEGLNNLLAAIVRLGYRHQRRTFCLGILLTMIDYRTRASRQNVERVRADLRNKVFAMEVRTNVRIAEAPEFGQTIFEYDPTSTAARSYELVADEVELRASQIERQAPAVATPRYSSRALAQSGLRVVSSR
jgi:chromosome partitioning protein